MSSPEWAYLKFPEIDFQNIVYYSAPKSKKKLKDLNEVDSELLKTFEKLGFSLNEQKRLANVAIDIVFDSVSIGTTFQEELSEYSIIFASMVTYGIPIIAVAWGLYYGESISILQIGSLLIILAGVYIVNKPQQN